MREGEGEREKEREKGRKREREREREKIKERGREGNTQLVCRLILEPSHALLSIQRKSLAWTTTVG